MLIDFFNALKQAGLPVSIKELLALLEGLENNLAFADLDEFYQLARLTLIKDEAHYDRYDRVFGAYFHGLMSAAEVDLSALPEDWLTAGFLRHLSDEDKARIERLGGLDKLLETLQQRLREQAERHAGGNKWIGTGGTSPFGHSGFNPEGIRIGGESTHKRALKVWQQRRYKNLDDAREIGTRNIKMALRKLRRFARTGAASELDLDDTIRSTADNAGLLDIKMVPERRNAVKLLIFFDVGGSMDPHVKACEELFSAARSEFKHLESFYFHNCLYERVWRDNARRWDGYTPTEELMHTYAADYRAVFVGDASMSPYEILHPNGSVEHMNDEAGQVWLQRVLNCWPRAIWLNPTPAAHWQYTPSIELIGQLFERRMYPLTLAGLDEGIRALAR